MLNCLFSRALRINRKTLGSKHLDTIEIMPLLAVVRAKLGQYKEAESLLSEALLFRQETLGDDHPDTVELKKIRDGMSVLEKLSWFGFDFDM